MTDENYSLIVVGTGFASSFFLWKYLRKAGPGERVLVLERGPRKEHDEQLKGGFLEAFDEAQGHFVNTNPAKAWIFRILFGGGSNCWVGNTPRQLPEDFELFSRYGVGVDWPLTYDELEEYYCEAEELMSISGPSDDSPFPRSRPYPLPPHNLTDPDRLIKKAFPGDFFVLPTARPSQSTSRRPRCCASHACFLCPIDSKFTILNSELVDAYADPRVSLIVGAHVQALDVVGGQVRGVRYREGADGPSKIVRGDVVAVGTNAIMNPHLLLRSGMDHPRVGRGLCEQVSAVFDVHLEGVESFQGSTFQTGHGYMLHHGRRRRDRAAALLETQNMPMLRMERGRWRERTLLKFICADLPRMDNRVRPNAEDPDKPEVVYHRHSDYAERAMQALADDATSVFAALPISKVDLLETPGRLPTDAHIQCTVPIGNDPAASVLDRHLVHHRYRNLLVLGSSAFPTCPPANPTLTLSALSLWAADHLMA